MAQITHKAHTHTHTVAKKTGQFKDRLEKSWLTRFAADPNRMRAAFHTRRDTHTTCHMPLATGRKMAYRCRQKNKAKTGGQLC